MFPVLISGFLFLFSSVSFANECREKTNTEEIFKCFKQQCENANNDDCEAYACSQDTQMEIYCLKQENQKLSRLVQAVVLMHHDINSVREEAKKSLNQYIEQQQLLNNQVENYMKKPHLIKNKVEVGDKLTFSKNSDSSNEPIYLQTATNKDNSELQLILGDNFQSGPGKNPQMADKFVIGAEDHRDQSKFKAGHTLWANGDFEHEGNGTIAGDLNVNNQLNVKTLVGKDYRLDIKDAHLHLFSNDLFLGAAGNSHGRALVGHGETLKINYGNDFTDGVDIQSAVKVKGKLIFDWQGKLKASCSEVKGPCRDAAAGLSNIYMDRIDASCSSGEFMNSIDINRCKDERGNSGMQFAIKCCSIGN